MTNRFVSFLFCLLCIAPVNAAKWNFKSTQSSDVALLSADVANWNLADKYYENLTTVDGSLCASGEELTYAKGLLFAAKEKAIRVNNGVGRLWINGGTTITIPNAKAGNVLEVVYANSGSTSRGLYVTNATVISGTLNQQVSKGTQYTATCSVTNDGNVVLSATDGALYVYSLSLSEPGDEGAATYYNNPIDKSKDQVIIKLKDGDMRYYDADALDVINVFSDTIRVTPSDIDGFDIFNKNVAEVAFRGADAEYKNTFENTEGKVEIIESRGWFESAFVKFALFEGASSYNVYVKGEADADYTKLDRELVRNYGTYGRADMVGLKAGKYSMKVVPVADGKELSDAANEATDLEVRNYLRDNFAHFKLKNTGVGAYNFDGTLKTGAKVFYVTKETAKTISTNVITSSKGGTTLATGLQAILDLYMKGYDSTPIDFRIIGCVTLDDLDKISSSAEGLQIKDNKKNIGSKFLNITVEGIGDDATTSGFGFLCHGAGGVEFRNFANMNCLDDCISIDTDNSYVWVHNMDFFYGKPGSDGDQAKGDGTIDIKGNSKYITVSYNHFWDCGKTSLCGMKSETGPNYIDYDHNWFDHADSRHPRVRTMTVHVWNNYFDGVSKYGVGATMGSSVYVDHNFFRNCNYPMLISLQGRDAEGSGTFSGENGGMIKSFRNLYVERSKNFCNYTQHTPGYADNFDCYEVEDSCTQIPQTVVAKVGGTPYNNFDTDPEQMYTYTPDAPADVPYIVTGWYGAGRMGHGDFQWKFSNRLDDTDYDVIKSLKDAIVNYQSKLVGFF
ncbi:MAG: pectate lyase [Prevotellaceae bacterium]|nr:pectate lyase [Prevotellaceae bacterium]